MFAELAGTALSTFGPALLSGAGSLFSGAQNSDEATWARDHSAWQANVSRDWQEHMSNTAYQRSTADMKAAGLNPMLAYHQGGASTPGGAMGTSAQAAPWQNPAGSFGATTAAQIRNMDANTDKTRAEEREIEDRRPTHEVTRDQLKQSIAESAMRIEEIIAHTSERDASAAQIKQQTENLRELIPQIRATVQQLRSHAQLNKDQSSEITQRIRENLPALEAAFKKLENLYKGMESPSRETTHAFESSATGSVLRTIKEALKDLIPAFGVIIPAPGRTNETIHRRGAPTNR